MANMSYGNQMAQIVALKKDLDECCTRLNSRMTLIGNRLQQAVGQGFPPETAQNYSAQYLSNGKKNIADFVDVVQKVHYKFWDDIFKELDNAAK